MTQRVNFGEDTAMSKSKPKAPPPPPPPAYGDLWKEYSSWTARSAQTRDKSSADIRSKFAAAGADKSVIDAALADVQKTYDSELKKYQTSSIYKLLEEGYDIARGAKKNPYSGKAAGQLYQKGSEYNFVDKGAVSEFQKKLNLSDKNLGNFANLAAAKKGTTKGTLNTLEQFYAGGYETSKVEVDAKAEASKRAKLASGGTPGGESTVTGYEKQKTAGTNPWVV